MKVKLPVALENHVARMCARGEKSSAAVLKKWIGDNYTIYLLARVLLFVYKYCIILVILVIVMSTSTLTYS